MAESRALESTLTKLSINPQATRAPGSSGTKKKAVAESWEDEDFESDSGDETDRPLSPQKSADYPSAPPPTPSSPTHFMNAETFANPYGYDMNGSSDVKSERSTRPEKTDAVAKRMIAGALGVKAPKKTEEQRAYERAVKEKEIKRRKEEKEAAVRAKEDAEKAKAAVWDD
ncbi:Uncharacterized protein BP5553_02098 [Venustampulla echinocandica]|uniref:Ubiquitin-like protein smt3 n=1 Tax=Venustampulla echinocandica TaxID=2656787 RepID=A0A370U2X0_9HELO|nr:Uncharacterized protein BP5553_02098 [Venustampulla echinocandica]RDL42119.1 Uncharacterized protein BP5553_02098 [Venustampulla echinocandica]